MPFMLRIFLVLSVVLAGGSAYGQELVPKRVEAFFDWKLTDWKQESDVFTGREINFPEILKAADGRLALAGIYNDDGKVRLHISNIADLLQEKNGERRLFRSWVFPAVEKKQDDDFSMEAGNATEIKASYGHGIYRISGQSPASECESKASLIAVKTEQDGGVKFQPLSCKKAWPIAVPVGGGKGSVFLLADATLIQRNTIDQGGQIVRGGQAALKSWIPDAESIVSIDVSIEHVGAVKIGVVFADIENKLHMCVSQWDVTGSALPSAENAPCKIQNDIFNPVVVRLNRAGTAIAVVSRDVDQQKNIVRFLKSEGDGGAFRLVEATESASFPAEISDVKGHSYIYFQSMHWLENSFYWVSQVGFERQLIVFNLDVGEINQFSPGTDQCLNVPRVSPFQDVQSLAEWVQDWRKLTGNGEAFSDVGSSEALKELLLGQNYFKNSPAWLPIGCRTKVKNIEFVGLNWAYPFKFNGRRYLAASVVVLISIADRALDNNPEPVVRLAIFEVN